MTTPNRVHRLARYYQPGVLVNAVHGVQVHPQAMGVVAGGMTYRPPVPAVAAPACPMPTKAGAACKGNPAELTGFCIGHSNMIGAALKELLGG